MPKDNKQNIIKHSGQLIADNKKEIDILKIAAKQLTQENMDQNERILEISILLKKQQGEILQLCIAIDNVMKSVDNIVKALEGGEE